MAAAIRPSTAWEVLACTLYPPMVWIDCGVRPMWPITGISARTSASIIGRRLRPPSSFTAWAPARIEHCRVANRVLHRHVVAEPGQIADHQRRRLGSGDGADVVGDVGHGDLERVVVAEDHHGHRVTDEDEVDPGVIDDPCTGRVVRRHHDQRLGPITDLAAADRRRGHRRACGTRLGRAHVSLLRFGPARSGFRQSCKCTQGSPK